MNFMAKVLGNCIVKMGKEKKKKKSLLMDIFENPDDFVLTAYVEDDELIVRLKRKEIVRECSAKETR